MNDGPTPHPDAGGKQGRTRPAQEPVRQLIPLRSGQGPAPLDALSARRLFELAPLPFLILEGDGLVCEANRRTTDWLGLSRDALLGGRFDRHVLEADRDAFASHLLQSLHTSEPVVHSLRLHLPEGKIRHVQMISQLDAASPTPRLATTLTDMSVVRQIITALRACHGRQRRLLRALRDSAAHLRRQLTQSREQEAELTRELAYAEHRERQRLAERLHGDVQQMLTGARLRLSALRQGKDEAPKLEAIEQLIDQAGDAIRAAVRDLSPPRLQEQGLVPALCELSQWFASHGLSVYAAVSAQAEPGQVTTRMLIFDAVRELLLNSLTHGAAAEATLTGDRTPDGALWFEVLDKGTGFDPEAAATDHGTSGGFGLRQLRHRLTALGGHLELDSAPGRGCRARMHLPARGTTWSCGA